MTLNRITLGSLHVPGRVLFSFVIAVSAVLLSFSGAQAGYVDLTWSAPSTNADGTPLQDLSGYRVYFGSSTVSCGGTAFRTVSSPTSTPAAGQTISYRLTGITGGTTYSATVSAVDASGNESACSNVAAGVAQLAFSVTPTTVVNVGSVAIGSFAEATFTVTNNGTTTLSGSASATAPFSIVSGGSFSLPAGGNQAVRVRFTPTTASTVTGNVNFTVDGDTISRGMTGTGTTAATSTLTVTKNGSGSGTVTSSPAGISCGTDCTESLTTGTSVTLTASPAAGSTFGGWSGGGCSGTGSCVVALTTSTSVTATFTATTRTLTVTKNGSGSGTVTSSPAGISCGTDCSQAYTTGTSVTLTAAPASGSQFGGWSGGGCSGTGSCTVTVSSATSVTATFTAVATPTLTVTRNGSGSGTVTSAPAGISCGTDCSQAYTTGTSVTLTAAPASGSQFGGWSGGGCGGTGSCTVTVSSATTVTATFTLPAPLTLTSLTADRTAPQPPGTAVTFTATVAGGVSPYQYKWWVWNGSTWTVARAWSTTNSFAWTPSVSNPNYRVGVWVRNAGSTADAYDNANSNGSIAFSIQASQAPATMPLTLTALTANRTAPQAPGSLTTFTAIASGGTAPYQYRWWIWDGNSWIAVQGWSTSNTFAWIPSAPSPYFRVAVWIRNSGSTTDAYDNAASLGSIPFPIQGQPLTLSGITADRPAPQPAGTATNFTAVTTGGTGPYQYKWWIWDGASWSIASNWSTTPTLTWAPPSANADYRVGVWIRNAFDTADRYDNANSNGSIPFPVR